MISSELISYAMRENLLDVDLVVSDAVPAAADSDYAEWANLAWLQHGAARLVIALLDTDSMAALNGRFKGVHKATDVLSFPSDLPAHLVQSAELACIGDVAVCEDVVARKAKEYRKNFNDRLAHTVVHAVLHLQGYRHDNDADARCMQALESDLLAAAGYTDPYLTG